MNGIVPDHPFISIVKDCLIAQVILCFTEASVITKSQLDAAKKLAEVS